MSFEHQNADRGDPAPRGEGASTGLGEGWGWALVQRDWSVRQRESVRPRIRLALARLETAIAWVRRVARVALRGIVHGPVR